MNLSSCAAGREEEGQEKSLSPCVLQEDLGPAAPRHVGSTPALTTHTPF